MNNKFYDKLGLKPHKKTTRFNLKKSIRKFFKISAMSHFNANFSLFSNCNLLKKTFNNSIQIKKLLKKKYKIHQSGFIFKAQLKKRNQVHYKDIFVKECPILNPLELDIDLNFVKNNYENYVIKNTFCNLNSSHNIELLVNYLVSKLTESSISPSFPLFYGFCDVIMKKFTIDYTDSYTDDILDHLQNDNLNIYFSQKRNKIFLQRKNFPCLLFFMEKMEQDIFELCKQNTAMSQWEWCAYIFQIIAALSVIQKYFGISHNDLHTSNIMYVKTKEKYLYYRYNSTLYRIPTYGKIIKIIDWGRATYNFNNLIGLNSVFSNSGDAFGQFILPGLINGKKTRMPNNSTDLAIFGANLLMDKHFPKSGDLYNLVKSWTKFKNGKYLFVDSNSFNMYIDAAQKCYMGIPENNIDQKCFKKFKWNKTIPEDKIIYQI